MLPKIVIFRPGTLGDQLVLTSILRDTDICSRYEVILIERKIPNRISAASFNYFNKFYSKILTYRNNLDLAIKCIYLRYKCPNIIFIYIPHSARRLPKVILENVFFRLFFVVRYQNLRAFLRHTNSPQRFVPEYERVSENIKAVLQSVRFRGKKLVSSSNDRIIIAPRSAWKSKDWPAEKFQRLVTELVYQGFEIILVGTSADRLEEFITYDDEVVSNKTKIMRDCSLEEVENVILSSKLFVGVDSAICHLAAGCGLPSVILFSDTNRAENWCPPYEHVTAIRKTVGCGGCFSARCLNIEHSCMSLITVPEVLEVISEKLSK